MSETATHISLEDRIDHWNTYRIGSTTIHVPVPLYKGPDYKEPTRKELQNMIDSVPLMNCCHYGE